MPELFKRYYRLTKPGIIYGNIFAFVGGFFLAARGNINWFLLAAAFIGLALVIGSGCVFNNIADRNIDKKMQRTKNREIPQGLISKRNAAIYGAFLGLTGAAILALHTNLLALLVALFGWVIYVLVYTPLKTRTEHAALIGSAAGAVPPVVGYVAVANHLDLAAILLFLILTFWQMPHFYGIAVRRQDEYAAANVPVLPLRRGLKYTKVASLFYMLAFLISAVLLTVFKYTGYFYLVVVVALGFWWLWQGWQWLKSSPEKDQVWAKKIFLFSLIILMVLSLMWSLSHWLP